MKIYTTLFVFLFSLNIAYANGYEEIEIPSSESERIIDLANEFCLDLDSEIEEADVTDIFVSQSGDDLVYSIAFDDHPTVHLFISNKPFGPAEMPRCDRTETTPL